MCPRIHRPDLWKRYIFSSIKNLKLKEIEETSFSLFKILAKEKNNNRITFYDYETDKNECSSGPCQNNGTCLDLINRFQCRCVPGYTGTQCEIGNIFFLVNRIKKKKTYKIHWYLQKVHLVTCQLGWYFLVCLWSRNHSTLIHVTKYRPTVNFIIVKYGFIVFTNIQWSPNVNYYFDIILSLLLLYFKIRNNRYN